ncbi:MAG: hypothetical protein ACP5OE_09325 [Thermodesulfobium sp.]
MNADMVFIYWDYESEGSLFDLGMTFMSWLISGKPAMYLLNKEDIEKIAKKSVKPFENVILMSAENAPDHLSKAIGMLRTKETDTK